MRVRLIRPAYWTDADLHTRLSADAREFYIGLWMEADDAGYVSWDLDRIGADLYPYRPLGWRRRSLAKWIEGLAINGHIRVLECGAHAVIPNLPKYQSPPKPSFQNQRAHDSCLRQMAPAGAAGRQRAPAQEGGLVGKEGKGIEGGSRRATNGASTDDEERGGGDLAKAFAVRGLPRPEPSQPMPDPSSITADAAADNWFAEPEHMAPAAEPAGHGGAA